MQNARAEVTKMIQSQKTAKQTELDAQYNEAKAKIAREVSTPWILNAQCVHGCLKHRGACEPELKWLWTQMLVVCSEELVPSI